jgi:hypothetical protein
MTRIRPPGLYEELITRRLEAELERVREEGWRDDIGKLDPAEAPQVIARFVLDLVEPLLDSYTGKRLMSITWRLHHPMPSDMFEEAKVVVG